MTDPKTLTPEQIPEALAKAQGWELEYDAELGSQFWTNIDSDFDYFVDEYNPLTNNYQYNVLTLDPEIHAGMIDVLDEWFIEQEYWHSPEYLQDIRLWQLRACVEFLRRKNGTQTGQG